MTDALREGFELGGYRIEATTGSQATGTIYRATHVGTGATVALHLIATRLAKEAHFRARFHRELGVIAELSHPHLLQVFETGEEGEEDKHERVRLWAAVAPSPGPDLATLARQRGRLTPVQAAQIVAQAAEALEEVHGRAVLHRGLEPASIHVNELESGEPSAQLGGFGLVDDGALEGGPGDIHRSAYPPSPDYVAPEQISGKHVDRPADVYALGGVLYFALTGRPPFEGTSIEEILNGHLRGKVPLPTQVARGVPETLNGVVARALAKNPAERYASAAELADDILRNSGARRGRSQPGAPPTPAPAPSSEPQAAAPAPAPASSSEPQATSEPVDPGSVADKQRVIQAWTEAVSAGGRLWSPSAAGSGVPAASSAAAPAPDEEMHASQGDFRQFDEARRRRAEQEGTPGEPEPVVPASEPEPVADEPEAEAEAPPGDAKVPEPSPQEEEAPGPAPMAAKPKRTPRPVELPPPRSERSGPSRPSRNVVVGTGAAALIAVLAIGGIVVAGGGDDNDKPDSAAAPEKPAAKKPATPAPKKKAPVGKDTAGGNPKPTQAKLVAWPGGEAYTAVAYANPTNRKGAAAAARKAARLGLKAGVLRSDGYPSLQPGAWVAFAGVYATETQAQRAADRLRRAKVASSPYVRFVGRKPR